MKFTKAKLEHAGVVALRNFTTFLGATQIILTVTFAKSLETAAIAALIAGVTDLATHA